MIDITEAQKKELLKIPEFKLIRQQYVKEQKMAGSGKMKMKMRGKGFWDDVGNWFYNAGQSVNNFLKSTKILSNVAGAVLPVLAPMATALLTLNPLASAGSVGVAKGIAEGVKSLGYGSKNIRMMPDGTMMRGKTHGGMMMKGKGLVRQSNGLIVNQKGGAIDPTLQALGKVALNMFSPLAGFAVQTGLDLINKPPKKMKGGDARLSIVPPEMRLRGKGLTRQYNGLIVNQKGGRMMRGRGAGTEYGTVSSAFGEIVM